MSALGAFEARSQRLLSTSCRHSSRKTNRAAKINEIFFSGDGVVSLRRGNDFFIRCGSGELVPNEVEVRVSQHQAERAQLSESDAYDALLATQRNAGC